MNIIESINYVTGPGCAEPLADFFNAMAMPLPGDKQFTRTTDLGALVFLDAPGCVLRITNDEQFPAIKHRRVLQPVFSRPAGAFRAEIFPGIRCPVSSDERIIEAAQELIEGGISFPNPLEIRDDNFGQLPDGFVVAVDMGALADTRAGTRETVRQDLYEDLAQAFGAAWPDGAARPDAGRLAQAWALCLKMKEQGLLAADWQQPGRYSGDFKGMKHGGTSYGAAWNLF